MTDMSLGRTKVLGWLITALCLFTSSHGTSIPIKFEKARINKALSSQWRISSKSTDGFGTCAYWCLSMTSCKSLNYRTKTQQCDINGADSSEAGGDLSTAPGCVFVDRSALPEQMALVCCGHACRDGQYCIPGSTNSPQCVAVPIPVGYSEYPGGSFYFALKEICLSWNEARENCQADGGDLLALPDDQSYAFFVQNLFMVTPIDKCGNTHTAAWIGASESDNNDWIWTTGVTLSKSNPNWRDTEPSGDGHCVQLNVDLRYRFNDFYCNLLSYFVCQFIP